MRDINALKRSKTFVEDYSENTIIIDMDNFEYYCYVDVFKDFIKHIPYYLGNCDIMINNEEFIKIKDAFIAKSIEKHPFLNKFYNAKKIAKDDNAIEKYFKNLLGDNYVY